MGDVNLSVNKRCEHNTAKGLAWKQIIKRKRLFGLLGSYTLIEKECQACGATFLSDKEGRRLLN